MKAKLQKTNKKIGTGAPIVFALLLLATCPKSAVAQSNTFPSSGKVGIGTTNPQADLEVNGDIRYRNANTYAMTRTLSVTVNNAVNIGDFAFANGSGSLRVSVTVSSSGYSAAKEYFFPISWGQSPNSLWTTALPISSTGAYYGNDFALDVRVTSGTASLRLRTTASDGAHAGTAYIVVQQYGVNTDTFTASTATSSVSAPVPSYSGTTVTQVNFNTGIGGTMNPVTKLDVTGPIRAGSPQACGDGVPNAQGAYLTWNQSCGTGETNFINHKGYGSGGGFAFMNTANGSSLSTLMFVAGSGNVGIGTASPNALLDLVSTTQSSNRIRFSGQEYYQAGNTDTHGVDLRLGVNRTNNRQLWFADSAAAINATNAQLRMLLGQTYAQLDSLSTDGTSGRPLILNGGGGNVGIGTVGPTYRLDVQGGQINTSGGLCIAGDCKTAWSQVTGGPTPWSTSGSSVYYNAGNVGIGTTSPTFLLDVKGSSSTPLRVRDSADREYFSTTTRTGTFGTTPVVSLAGSRLTIENSGPDGTNDTILRHAVNSLVFNPSDDPNLPGAFMVRQVGGNSILYVDQTANGKVGIGTTTPTTKLHVVGDGKVTGNLTVDGNIAAKYQDVAEWVPASKQIPAGTVVVLDSTRSNQVISSTQAYDTRVAGVISEKPGIALGESGKNKVLVATTGRVRIKVDATRGPIHIGDLLVTSDISGMAMKSEPVSIGGVQIHRPGTLIGKALEPLERGSGTILVLLSLQ